MYVGEETRKVTDGNRIDVAILGSRILPSGHSQLWSWPDVDRRLQTLLPNINLGNPGYDIIFFWVSRMIFPIIGIHYGKKSAVPKLDIIRMTTKDARCRNLLVTVSTQWCYREIRCRCPTSLVPFKRSCTRSRRAFARKWMRHGTSLTRLEHFVTFSY